jgi:hypothetical protein
VLTVIFRLRGRQNATLLISLVNHSQKIFLWFRYLSASFAVGLQFGASVRALKRRSKSTVTSHWVSDLSRQREANISASAPTKNISACCIERAEIEHRPG